MNRKHMGITDRHDQQNTLFVMLMGCAEGFEANEASILLISLTQWIVEDVVSAGALGSRSAERAWGIEHCVIPYSGYFGEH